MYYCIKCTLQYQTQVVNQNICNLCFVTVVGNNGIGSNAIFKYGNTILVSPLLGYNQYKTAAQVNQAHANIMGGQQFPSTSSNSGTHPIKSGIRSFEQFYDVIMRQILLKLNAELFEFDDKSHITNVVKEQIKEQIKTDPEILMCINEAVSEVLNSENIHSLVAEAIKEQIIEGIRLGLKK